MGLEQEVGKQLLVRGTRKITLTEEGVLLPPVDTTKYEYLSLPDSARWGLLLPESSVLAGKAGVERKDLLGIPLILHQRIGLQQEIAHWAQIEIEQLHIAATYNVINGNPAAFLQSGLGVSADHG